MAHKCRICKRNTIRNSDYCIFHYGLQFEDDEQIAGRLEDIEEGFIEEFRKYAEEVKNSKEKILNCYKFVFPAFDPAQWNRLWESFGANPALDYTSVDFEKLGVSVDFTEARFLGDVNFMVSRFGNGASFIMSEFHGSVDFTGSRFGDGALFNGAKFHSKVNFVRSRFGDGALFDGANFGNEVSFNGAGFGNGVSFVETEFNGKVNFVRSRFGDGVSFDGAKFGNEVSFNAASFGNRVSFVETEFNGKVNFVGSRFGDGALFGSAKFGNEVNFNSAEFGSGASFIKTEFNGKVNFVGSRFGDGALFGSAKFGNEVNFNSAEFGSGASFIKTEFNGKVDFVGSRFGDGALFDRAKFSDKENEVSFNRASFGNRVSFIETEFHGKVDFAWSRFGDGASFDSAKLGNEVSFNSASFGNGVSFIETEFNGKIDFTGSRFGDGVSFDRAKLGNEVSFNSASFGNRTSFNLTKFHDKVNFVGSRFGDRTYFAVFFLKQVDFSFSSGGSLEFYIYDSEQISDTVLLQNIMDGKIRISVGRNIDVQDALLRFRFDGTNFIHGTPRVFIEKKDKDGNFQPAWDLWPPRPGVRSKTNKKWFKRLKGLVRSWGIREVERIYRQVRLIMEYNGRFSDAGSLYMVEMFLRTNGILSPELSDTLYKTLFLRRWAGYLAVLKTIPVLLAFSIIQALSGYFFASAGAFVLSLLLSTPLILFLYRFRRYLFGIRFLEFLMRFVEFLMHIYYGLVSKWGEDVVRPIGLLFLVSFAFGITVPFVSGELLLRFDGSSFVNTILVMCKHAFQSFRLMVFPFMRFDDYSKMSFMGSVIDFLLRLYGVVFIALFVLALKRKFSRVPSQ